jgi:hypothetical protein
MTDLDTSKANVHDLGKKRKGNKSKTDDSTPSVAPKKISFATIQTRIRKWMDGDLLVGFQSFPHTFVTIRKSPKAPIVIIENINGDGTFVDEDYVAGSLFKALENPCSPEGEAWVIDFERCRKVVTAWMHTRNHQAEMPAFIGWKSTQGLVLYRHKFDPIEGFSKKDLIKHAPTIWTTLKRTTNPVAYCMRMGSIFDPKADRKQVAWLYGESNGGKSFITEMLKFICGEEFFKAFEPTDNNKADALAELYEIRVGIVNEAPMSFLLSRLFKILTGGEQVRGRKVYSKAIQFIPIILLFCMSNEEPSIPEDESIKSRLIPHHVGVIPEHERILRSQVTPRIEKEMPYFLSYCWRLWQHNLKKGRPNLPVSRLSLDQAVSKYMERYEDFVNWYITNPTRSEDYIYKHQLSQMMDHEGFKDGREQRKIYDLIQKRWPQSKHSRPKQADGLRPNVIAGVSLRTTQPRQYSVKVAPPLPVEISPGINV